MRLPSMSAPTRPAMPAFDVHDRAAREVERALLEQEAGGGRGGGARFGVRVGIGARQNHTMCRDRQVREGEHSTVNSRTAPNLMRSANAPTISAGVMAANVSWNTKYTYSGM